MLVWGGSDAQHTSLGSGSRYNPVAQTWKAISTQGAPVLSGTTSVWTGQEMIVFGGNYLGDFYNDGASYRLAL